METLESLLELLVFTWRGWMDGCLSRHRPWVAEPSVALVRTPLLMFGFGVSLSCVPAVPTAGQRLSPAPQSRDTDPFRSSRWLLPEPLTCRPILFPL